MFECAIVHVTAAQKGAEVHTHIVLEGRTSTLISTNSKMLEL